MEQDQEGARSLPPPPPFYQQFTQSNIEQLEAARKTPQNPQGRALHLAKDAVDNLEPHLRYLIPPKPPAASYSAFGEQHSDDIEVPGLPEDIERLVPTDADPTKQTKYLIQLLRSILLNFLELVGTLSIDAEVAKVKIGDLRTLFFNIHDTLNRCRPHQARESLISLMEDQLRQKREEIAGVQEKKEKVDDYLNSLSVLEESDPLKPSKMRSDVNDATLRKQDQHQAWHALDSIEA